MQTQNPEEGKSELLKRGEIKTMAKDIARLRELETKAEGEKISAIKAEEKLVTPPVQEKPIQDFQQESAVLEKAPLESLMPKAPAKKKRVFKKIFVRLALLGIFALILAVFLYNNFKSGPKEATPVSDIQNNVQNPQKEQIFFPQSLIRTDQTKIIELSEGENASQAFSQVLAQKIPDDNLTEILIKNGENNFISLKEALSVSFGFLLPENIIQKLEQDYTLSIMGQQEGNRLAFIAKTNDKQGLIDSLKKWEKATTSVFKTGSLQNTLFRYLTLDKNDSGICYLVLDDYFVLTSSFKSMERMIKELNFEQKLGQLLMLGFEGKTLTPQLESFFKKYKPGALLLLSQNIESKEQLKALASQLQALSLKETGFPLLIAVDQEGGIINRADFLEEKTPQKNIMSNENAFQIGQKRGLELKSLGINLNLAPVLDLSLTGDFLFERSFQKTAEISGNLAKFLISGQKSAGILTSIKHFPGYSGIGFNPENKLAELEAVPEISQFRKAMEAIPEFVMTSNVIYKEIDSLPFSFSPRALKFLKESLGESVLVLSDDLAQDSLIQKFSLKEVMQKPIEAGIDMIIFSGYKVPVEQGVDEFIKAYKNNEIPKEKAEKAIQRIAQLKNNMIK